MRFEKVPRELAQDTSISLAARGVYPVLLGLAWDTARATVGEEVELPSVRDLAAACGCGPTALKLYLQELRRAGWLTTLRQARGKPQRYILHAFREPESGPQNENRGTESGSHVGRNPAHSRARDPYSDLEQTVEPTVPPRRVRVDGRDLPVDALVASCDVPTSNKRKMAELAGALKELRQYAWDDLPLEERIGLAESSDPAAFERHLAGTIADRGRAYQQHPKLRDAMLTPSALAKWWHDLDPRRVSSNGRQINERFASIDKLG